MTVLIAFMLTAAVLFTATEAVLSRSWLAAATVAALCIGAAGCMVLIAFAVGAT